ncbi:hypothetical protein AB0N12_34145, partial [Streptomyces albogriseolus]
SGDLLEAGVASALLLGLEEARGVLRGQGDGQMNGTAARSGSSDPYEECKVLNNLGSTLVEKGDYAGAIATYERAAEVGAAVNEPHLTSQIGRNMQFAVAKEAIMNADSADDLDYSRTRATRDEPSLPDRVRSWLRRRPNR